MDLNERTLQVIPKMVSRNAATGDLYACEVCGFAYSTKELAQKCEDYCETHNGCSLEITRHAVRKAR